MTQDEIIEMARQAMLMSEYDETSPWVEGHEITEYVEAFAKLVADVATAKEREACAELCENSEIEGSMGYGQICADVIRSRG
jgi:hypothetical protein